MSEPSGLNPNKTPGRQFPSEKLPNLDISHWGFGHQTAKLDQAARFSALTFQLSLEASVWGIIS